MPRKYSNDEEYNKRLENILSSNEYVSGILEKYKEFEQQYISKRSESIAMLGDCSVPQEPFENKADVEVCAPDMAQVFEPSQELYDAAAESESGDELIDCISGDGPHSLKSISESIQEMAEELADLKLVKDKFDEFYYNARFYAYYLDRRVHKKKKLNLVPRVPEVLYGLLKTALLTYSTNIGVTYNLISNRILSYTVHLDTVNDLKNYTMLNTKTSKMKLFNENGKFLIRKTTKTCGKGSLYKKYYDTISDPIENLYTLEERGMSSRNNSAGNLQAASVDDKGNPTSYIKDAEKYKKFYLNLDASIDGKMKKCYKKSCDAHVKVIELLIDELVQSEGFTVSKDEKRIYNEFYGEGGFFDEYDKIAARIEYLKDSLSEDNINKMLANNPCFSKKNTTEQPDSNDDLTGGYSIPGGKDPNNPTFEQSCYWVKFAQVATQYGLMPYPELGMTMRYWGVGLKIATPSGILKIPMPTIWIPLVTLSTNFGVFVFFIGQIGIVPHPFVLWINRDGAARFIITMKGVNLNGEVIGYDPDNDDFLPTKSISIPRPSLDAFKTLTKGVFNLEKALDIETDKYEEINDDLIDIGELNKLNMETTVQELNSLMYAYNEKKEQLKEAFSVNDTIVKAAKYLNDEIDKIRMPELRPDLQKKLENGMHVYQKSIDDFVKLVKDILDAIELPSIRIPDDLDLLTKIKLPTQTKEFDEMIKTLESLPVPNVNLADISQVKQFVTARIMRVINSGKVQEKLMELPEELDVLTEEDFELIKSFIILVCDEIVDMINPLTIFLPTVLDKFLSLGTNFSASVGIGCKGFSADLDLEIDPSILALINTLRSMLESPWRELTYQDVMSYITHHIIKRSQLVDFVKYIMEELLPDIELPFDMVINPYEILIKIIKVMKLMANPKAAIEPYVNGLIDKLPIPQVVLSLESFKLEILKFVTKMAEYGLIPIKLYSLDELKVYLHGIVNLVLLKKIPEFLYKPILKKIGEVENIEKEAEKYIMGVVCESLPELFKMIDTVKDTIRTINDVARIVKIIKNSNISKDSLNQAFSPMTLLNNAKNIALCAAGLGKNCEKLPSLCDIVLVDEAMKALEKMGVMNFVVVSSACWLDREHAELIVRAANPVANVDDIPPYERLSLDNGLFCLFLDDFCHISKSFSLFGERYGY